jgi:hypothetical protein
MLWTTRRRNHVRFSGAAGSALFVLTTMRPAHYTGSRLRRPVRSERLETASLPPCRARGGVSELRDQGKYDYPRADSVFRHRPVLLCPKGLQPTDRGTERPPRAASQARRAEMSGHVVKGNFALNTKSRSLMRKCPHEKPGNRRAKGKGFSANHRSTVYAVLEQLLASGLVEELRG